MSAAYPTRLQTRRLNGMARRFTLAVTAERRADLDSLLDEGVRFLQACKYAGMPTDYIDDTARGLHDQLSNLMAGIDRDLDDVGEPEAPPLEMCELEELFQKPRFANVGCSQCGETFGPGNEGFSHCHQHYGKGATSR